LCRKFISITDQKRPVRILAAFLKKSSIPHALLFTGIEGVGKKEAAITFAMACNCMVENDLLAAVSPCGSCRSCRKIDSGNHPDIIEIKPSGPFIKIDQIRDFCDILAMKPYEARIRVVIISDADAMNPAAGNALLKMLEEPPDSTILILTAYQTSDLLPTIVSRCRHIRFNPISRESIKTLLIENEKLDPDDAFIIAAMAKGSISKAFAMSKSNWMNRRNWLINAGGLDQPGSLSSKPSGMLLSFAEALSKKKDLLSDSLETIKSWLRDLVIFKFCPEKMINKDLTDKIQYASQKVSVSSLLSKIEAIETAQKDIKSNANLRLTLETMMLRIAGNQEKGNLY